MTAGSVAYADAIMTRERLWLSLAILLPALAATIAPMSTIDLAYQVRAGELMLGTLSVLRTDPFTFTAFGEPWLNQQWGAGVLFAAVHGLGGWGGLVVLRVVLVSAAVGLVTAGAMRRQGPRSAALLALAAFVVGIASVGLRAQLFEIRAVHGDARDPRVARPAPPMADVGHPAPGARLGEPPRELLPAGPAPW